MLTVVKVISEINKIPGIQLMELGCCLTAFNVFPTLIEASKINIRIEF